MTGARLEGWLRAVESIDLVAPEAEVRPVGAVSLSVEVDEGTWEVWATNGREAPLFVGTPIASCDDELKAELVAEALRTLRGIRDLGAM